LKPSREVTISLVISNKNRQTKLIDAFIDAGYTGFLSLPREIIIALNFLYGYRMQLDAIEGGTVTIQPLSSCC
jgi:predicted aspartyl protease